MRRIVLGLAAVGAVFLGLSQIGTRVIAPGSDLDVRVSPGRTRSGIVLQAGAGDVVCSVRLKLRDPRVAARFSDGRRLAVVHGTGHWIELREQTTAAGDARLKWTHGVDLEVDPIAGPLIVDDWVIYPDKGGHDSLARTRRRNWWFWVQVVVLGLVTGGAIFKAWPEPATKPPFTDERCLVQIIEGIEGTADEAKVIRHLLSKVLVERRTLEEAFESANLRDVRSRLIWFTARRRFLARIDSLIGGLDYYRALAMQVWDDTRI